MIGSKYRAKKLVRLTKDSLDMVKASDLLSQKHDWKNGDIDLYGADIEDFLPRFLPRGYQYLGSGASRHAILAPDGLVYKVSTEQKDEDWDEEWMLQNEIEATAYRELTKVRVKGIRIARTYALTRQVNVAEYVRGTSAGTWPKEDTKRYDKLYSTFSARVEEHGWRASDVYFDNVKMTPRGTFVIVDTGCFYRVESNRNFIDD